MCIECVLLREMTATDVIRKLQADGWFQVAQKGSHRQFAHTTKPGRMTVPMHGQRDLKRGTLRSIECQAGLRLRG
jgi:predicted RNA binding protein YcfA (HicA-like mRNA interferase family)